MQLVLVYALGAALAVFMASISGPETPVAVFWLYVLGAIFFAIAALGQYFKMSKAGR